MPLQKPELPADYERGGVEVRQAVKVRGSGRAVVRWSVDRTLRAYFRDICRIYSGPKPRHVSLGHRWVAHPLRVPCYSSFLSFALYCRECMAASDFSLGRPETRTPRAVGKSAYSLCLQPVERIGLDGDAAPGWAARTLA